MTTDFTADEIETGRRLFAGDWDFVSAASSIASLPRAQGIEIAVRGALERRQVEPDQRAHRPQGARPHVAHARAHAGADLFRPRRRAHPRRHAGLRLCPGAEGQDQGVDRSDPRAICVAAPTSPASYVLIDARHGLKAADEPVLDMLDETAVSYAIVLTKADQVKPAELAEATAAIATALAKRPAAFPDVIATSARTGGGNSRSARRDRAARARARRRLQVRRSSHHRMAARVDRLLDHAGLDHERTPFVPLDDQPPAELLRRRGPDQIPEILQFCGDVWALERVVDRLVVSRNDRRGRAGQARRKRSSRSPRIL